MENTETDIDLFVREIKQYLSEKHGKKIIERAISTQSFESEAKIRVVSTTKISRIIERVRGSEAEGTDTETRQLIEDDIKEFVESNSSVKWKHNGLNGAHFQQNSSIVGPQETEYVVEASDRSV